MSSTATFIDLARQVAQGIAPRADAADRAGRLPPEDVQLLKESGYLALSIPQEYGGGGASLRQVVEAQLEVAQVSPSTALVAAMTLQVFGDNAETQPWPAEQYAALAQQVAQHKAVMNVVASEPALGSPSRGKAFASQASPQAEGGWLIDGHKTWVTGGQHLTHLLIRLMVGDSPGILVVPANSVGLRWEATWKDALAFRASDSHDLYLEGVRVGPEALLECGDSKLPHPNAWFPMLMASIYLGAAWGARNAVIRFALERIPTALGKPIATLPKIQRQIGELDIQWQAAHSLLLEVASAWSAHPEQRPKLYARVAGAKHFAVESALRITDLALQIAGGQSLTHDLPLERFLRDVRAGTMQPPAGDTALEIAGRGALERG
jgi:alkylation response protein AidB-like acyl-CoA dehydrogenase